LRNIIFVAFLFLMSCTGSAGTEKTISAASDTSANNAVIRIPNDHVCNTNFDTTLVRLAKSFQPRDLHITESMSNELNQFMLHVDTTCLRKQKMYQFFIVTIWAKIALYQLKCCNQHYEMRPEKNGAKIILEEFERMAGFQNKHVEFLSSAEAESFIKRTPELYDNPYLRSIMVKIQKESARISGSKS
jgi:hypothetical protein